MYALIDNSGSVLKFPISDPYENHKNFSFPMGVLPDGIVEVFENKIKPKFNRLTQKLDIDGCEKLENRYVLKYKIVDLDEFEKENAKFIYLSDLKTLFDNKLQFKAKEKGYYTIDTACSYVGVENPFREESEKFVIYRANIWILYFDILKNIENGIYYDFDDINVKLDNLIF